MINQHMHCLHWSCCLARNSRIHNSSQKSSSDSSLMEKAAHKHLGKISGAGIYVSLQVQDLKTFTHSVNFTKLTSWMLQHIVLVKRKHTSSCFSALFLKIYDTMSFFTDKKEFCVRFPGLSNPKALHSVRFWEHQQNHWDTGGFGCFTALSQGKIKRKMNLFIF